MQFIKNGEINPKLADKIEEFIKKKADSGFLREYVSKYPSAMYSYTLKTIQNTFLCTVVILDRPEGDAIGVFTIDSEFNIKMSKSRIDNLSQFNL